MGFREVGVVEVREVLRAWLKGEGLQGARRAGVDRKTARRFVALAQAAGLTREAGTDAVTDELIGLVVEALATVGPTGHGVAWRDAARARGADPGVGRRRRARRGQARAVVCGEDRGAARRGWGCRMSLTASPGWSARSTSPSSVAERPRDRTQTAGALPDVHCGAEPAHVRVAHLRPAVMLDVLAVYH